MTHECSGECVSVSVLCEGRRTGKEREIVTPSLSSPSSPPEPPLLVSYSSIPWRMAIMSVLGSLTLRLKS